MINYLTAAEDIRGPWSDPIRVNGVGFDASLFHDDDGRKYLVQQTWDHREYHHAFDGITVTEFDTDTMKLKPETARTIYAGTDVKLVEGPHLYKINGYYYLFAAPVSYTHLDVYKRQHAYHSTKDHYAYVKNGNGSFSGSNVGKGNWSKIEVAHKGNSITSVSYTHLFPSISSSENKSTSSV